MPEASALLLFLSVIGVCLIVLTGTLLWLAWRCHQTLHRLDALLVVSTPALREARRSLQEVRRILENTHHATRSVAAVLQQACDAASDALGRATEWTAKAHALWRPSHRTNGARGEPRRRHPAS